MVAARVRAVNRLRDCGAFDSAQRDKSIANEASAQVDDHDSEHKARNARPPKRRARALCRAGQPVNQWRIRPKPIPSIQDPQLYDDLPENLPRPPRNFMHMLWKIAMANDW